MPLLKALCQARPSKRKDILKNCSTDFLQSLCELSLNLLKGNIPLSGAQYKKLKKQKKIIKLLASKKTNIKTKHKALRKQSGGFSSASVRCGNPYFRTAFRRAYST